MLLSSARGDRTTASIAADDAPGQVQRGWAHPYLFAKPCLLPVGECGLPLEKEGGEDEGDDGHELDEDVERGAAGPDVRGTWSRSTNAKDATPNSALPRA